MFQVNQCSAIKKNKDELFIELVHVEKNDDIYIFYSRNDKENRMISFEPPPPKKKTLGSSFKKNLGGGGFFSWVFRLPSLVGGEGRGVEEVDGGIGSLDIQSPRILE